MAWPGHGWISLLVRMVLGVMFIYASFHKIAEPRQFAVDIATYQILPLYLINLQAIILPWLELMVGGLLIVGFCIKGTSLLAGAMLMMFTTAIAVALFKGLQLSCGCFASSSMDQAPISSLTLIRDFILLLLPFYLLIIKEHKISIDNVIKRRNNIP